LDPHPYLQTGVRVRVRTGPLRGVEGVVEVKPRVDRLVLQVHALGQAASLEIDPAEVEPLD
jgi:transcription antitermination factor NusG